MWVVTPGDLSTVPGMDRYLTLTEAAITYDVSRTRLRALAKAGELGETRLAASVGRRDPALLVAESALVAAGFPRRHRHPDGHLCIEGQIDAQASEIADIVESVAEGASEVAALRGEVDRLHLEVESLRATVLASNRPSAWRRAWSVAVSWYQRSARTA